jgi:flagellar assembly factor FliW
MSANLKAPIIINNKTKAARQIVLQDSKLEVRYKMYMDLKKYIVNYTSDDSKRTNVTAVAKTESATTVSHVNVNKSNNLQEAE